MKFSELFESKYDNFDRDFAEIANSHIPIAWTIGSFLDAGLKKGDVEEQKFKSAILKKMLYQMKTPPWNISGEEMKTTAKEWVENLRKMGFDWPELDTIEKSVK